jgi:hypothetical protein
VAREILYKSHGTWPVCRESGWQFPNFRLGWLGWIFRVWAFWFHDESYVSFKFADVQFHIQTLRDEITGNLQFGEHLETPHVNEDDLSVKKLNEFLFELQALQKEKVVTNFIVCLVCAILQLLFLVKVPTPCCNPQTPTMIEG